MTFSSLRSLVQRLDNDLNAVDLAASIPLISRLFHSSRNQLRNLWGQILPEDHTIDNEPGWAYTPHRDLIEAILSVPTLTNKAKQLPVDLMEGLMAHIMDVFEQHRDFEHFGSAARLCHELGYSASRVPKPFEITKRLYPDGSPQFNCGGDATIVSYILKSAGRKERVVVRVPRARTDKRSSETARRVSTPLDAHELQGVDDCDLTLLFFLGLGSSIPDAFGA